MNEELDADRPSPEKIAEFEKLSEYFRNLQPERTLTTAELDKAIDEIIKEGARMDLVMRYIERYRPSPEQIAEFEELSHRFRNLLQPEGDVPTTAELDEAIDRIGGLKSSGGRKP